jgi:uncharacterized protein
MSGTLPVRIAALDWDRITDDLHARGFAPTGRLLNDRECDELIGNYCNESRYRSKVVMARHGFGQGEYQYFSYPLPESIAALRENFYPKLAPIANAWHRAMHLDTRYPTTLDAMIDRCHRAGQCRPTPLILKYQADDYNCLHQDLYGEHVFPLQVAFLLSAPDEDFAGGEFVLVEQRPRMQSRPHVVPLQKGEGIIFAVHHRPVQGSRGTYRANMRHGVSRVTQGNRYTAGVIFHDAK